MTEDDVVELNAPPAGPVEWFARKHGTKKKIKLKAHQTWFTARGEAMRRLKCSPSEVEVWLADDPEPT